MPVKSPSRCELVLSGLFLFVLFSCLILAPWEFDQIKILLWCYLLINLSIYESIIRKLNWKLKAVSALVLFYPGFLQLVHSLPAEMIQKGYAVSIFSAKEVNATEGVMRQVSVNDVVACEPVHTHPLFFFGQKVLLGYPGHVWSHGYNIADREEKLDQLMKGENNWLDVAHEFHVKYIYWGDPERARYGDIHPPWEKELKAIFVNRSASIYEIPAN